MRSCAPSLRDLRFGTNPLMHVESGIRWENVTIFLYISMAEAFQRAESIVSSLILVSHWRLGVFTYYADSPLK
jgi:hypothetical protein